MFKTKILWALVLGVVTSALLREAKINLAYSPLWSRIPHVLTAPGTRFVAAINMPGTLMEGSTRFWAGVAFIHLQSSDLHPLLVRALADDRLFARPPEPLRPPRHFSPANYPVVFV